MNEPNRIPMLPAAQQQVVAFLAAIGLLAMGISFLRAGGCAGKLVPYDSPPRRTAGFSIDLNTASRAELMQLPGIGPRTADRILEARTARGSFASIDELTDVPGIGELTLERIRRYLRRPAGPFEPNPEPDRDVRTRQPVRPGR